MALDAQRCDLGTKNCAFATLFRHTAADPAVGFNIFVYQNCVSNQGRAVAGKAEVQGITLLDTIFKDL